MQSISFKSFNWDNKGVHIWLNTLLQQVHSGFKKNFLDSMEGPETKDTL